MNVRNIKVLNYLPSVIAVSSRDKSVALQPCEDGIPTFEYFTEPEIQYINSTSTVFKTGALEFEEDEREEIYAMLSMPDWKTKCLFQRDIDELVLNATVENLQRIADIGDSMTLERVRGRLDFLMLSGANVSTNAHKVVEARYKELARGERVSKIEVVSMSNNTAKKEETVAELQAQIEQMKAAIAQLTAMKEGNQEAKSAETEKKEEPVNTATKVANTAKAPAVKKAPASRKTTTAKK